MKEMTSASIASAPSKVAAKADNYDKGHKRFKGIVKATNKELSNKSK